MLLAICNIQIVSFFVVCLLSQFFDLLRVCTSIFIFEVDLIFQFLSFFDRHYFTFTTFVFFVNTICIMELHRCPLVLCIHYLLCIIFQFFCLIIVNCWRFSILVSQFLGVLCCLQNLLTYFFKFIMIMLKKLFCYIVLSTPHRSTRCVGPWSSDKFYIYVY